MSWLNYEEFSALQTKFDERVRRACEIDRFCSSTDWIEPARVAFMPYAEPYIWHTENAFCVFGRVRSSTGHWCAIPWESGWHFSCPLVGENPAMVVGGLAAALSQTNKPIDYVLISGLKPAGGLRGALEDRFSGRVVQDPERAMTRCIASLDGGLDGVIARRSSKFRATLRRLHRRLRDEEFSADVIVSDDPDRVMARILSVEQKSWKGLTEQGIDHPVLDRFYRPMVNRLLAKDRFRAVFVRRGEEDVAYAFGALYGKTFRGLQLSYDARFKHVGLGHMAQLALVEHLCQEGIGKYDLGMDMPYKQKWAETQFTTDSVWLVL